MTILREAVVFAIPVPEIRCGFGARGRAGAVSFSEYSTGPEGFPTGTGNPCRRAEQEVIGAG